jgi:hypothetical protein
MNYWLIPTLVIAILLYVFGASLARRTNPTTFRVLCGIGFIIAIPGVAFAAYYLKILGEPVWLYQFRSMPGSELAAGGAGFLAGLLHGRFSGGKRFRRIAGRWFFPVLLAIGLLVPYLKPLVRPPRWDQFHNLWSDGVCLQTSESSCGPACAATLLHQRGQTVTEAEIAKASFTSRNGTENWYLARALRSRGARVEFVFEPDPNKPWPHPAIAGVRLPGSGNSGHFIVVLDQVGDKYILGDPLEGKIVESRSQLRQDYDFTGFFMVVK